MLVGTTSIETSEWLSDRLRKSGIQHQVLNARNHEQEANIIAQAGRGRRRYRVHQQWRAAAPTSSSGALTPTARTGRPNTTASSPWAACTSSAPSITRPAGWTTSCGAAPDARATRAAASFFVALEDELMQRFGGDRIRNVMNWTGLNEDEPLENKLITKSITSAQVKVEGHHFDIRKHLLNFDDVLNQQRTVIYDQRSRILAGQGLRDACWKCCAPSSAT